MKNRNLKITLLGIQGFLFVAFNFFLLLTVFQLFQDKSAPYNSRFATRPAENKYENFDPELMRLNSLNNLLQYCDSLYANQTKGNSSIQYASNYPELVSSVVTQRFYHGYSRYGYKDNFIAVLLSKLTIGGLSAIVAPDEILKYPYAACSQQSIVMMEVLRKKGFTTRKIGFKGKTYGHFCFEVFYNNSWHFFDPDMEPDVNVLKAYNRPGIAFLASNQKVLLDAYKRYSNAMVLDIFPNYFYGPVNKFPAPKALLFQKITKVFGYCFWAFFLAAFIFVRRKYLRISRSAVKPAKLYIPRLQEEMAPVYYPKYSA